MRKVWLNKKKYKKVAFKCWTSLVVTGFSMSISPDNVGKNIGVKASMPLLSKGMVNFLGTLDGTDEYRVL